MGPPARRNRFSASHCMMAMRLVWLPSMVIRSGLRWRAGLAQKALRSLEIAVCGEVELDRIAIVVDGAIQIKPRAFDLYISLVEVPFPRDLAFSPIEAVKQPGAEMLNPRMHRRMIQRDAALGHHLLQVAQAQIINQIPSNT